MVKIPVIVFMVVTFAIYILIALVLNDLHKKIYGFGTAKSFIPVLDLYVLGKVAFNKFAGWALIFACLLNGTYEVAINGQKTIYKLFDQGISDLYNLVFSLVVVGLFVYAIVKSRKLKKIENIGLGSYVEQEAIYKNYQQSVQEQSSANRDKANEIFVPSSDFPQLGKDEDTASLQSESTTNSSMPMQGEASDKNMVSNQGFPVLNQGANGIQESEESTIKDDSFGDKN